MPKFVLFQVWREGVECFYYHDYKRIFYLKGEINYTCQNFCFKPLYQPLLTRNRCNMYAPKGVQKLLNVFFSRYFVKVWNVSITMITNGHSTPEARLILQITTFILRPFTRPD